jgi:hypothetical protein
MQYTAAGPVRAMLLKGVAGLAFLGFFSATVGLPILALLRVLFGVPVVPAAILGLVVLAVLAF